ncbi:hypothetical protein B0A52_03290 [Exophiala mesophila]|uniref:Amidase domain-containing protein n=1 Tax=Exophiala mesophila TaxID=212818 RepID=A0A438NBC1_EXOME|nr:hypothetical protein B0A52_03290 [Exophiala mesophila]
MLSGMACRSLSSTLNALTLLLIVFTCSSTGLSIVEATFEDLQGALSAGQVNAVQLLAKHLHRIAHYDRRGPRLNAIPVINPVIFDEAQRSDELRAKSGGKIRSDFDGLPCSVKDSYMLEGVTVASGSPAFANLTSTHDAFTVGRIKQGGGIVVGKSTMPPMANGGMQRGVHGKAMSPYNPNFLPAAMGSGSSNGGGVSVGASLVMFGMGEETVSSGRSPASNNGLVAYTPSWGMLSIRGNWPLQPALDVVVPYTRTVEDMMSLLDVIVATDDLTVGDFWRGQPWIPLPAPEDVRPKTFKSLADPDALRGKTIGVPKMFIGGDDPDAVPVYIRPTVLELWNEVVPVLESLGATIVEVDFPLATRYQIPPLANTVGSDYPLPAEQGAPTPPELAAYAWDDFLIMNNDVNTITTLADADPSLIFPNLPGLVPDRYGNSFGGNRTVGYARSVSFINESRIPTYELPGLETLLTEVTELRKTNFEDWLDANSLDMIAFPANGDIGPEDMEVNNASAALGWRNGVARSNGNNVLRKFGVPSVSVAMGIISDIQMPIDITFASKAYDDSALLSYAYAFEQVRQARIAPPGAPELPTDLISKRRVKKAYRGWQPPTLSSDAIRSGPDTIEISGTVSTTRLESLEVYLDGESVGAVAVADDGSFTVTAEITSVLVDDFIRPLNMPDQDLSMVVVVATTIDGQSTGRLLYA